MKLKKLGVLLSTALVNALAFGAQQHIDFGSGAPNDGDTAPDAFLKIEQNTTETYAAIDALSAQIAGLALDDDLMAFAALTPANDDILQRKAGAWTNRTPAQFKLDLSLAAADFGLGNVDNTSDASKPVSTATQTALNLKQTLDADLTSIAGLSPTNDDIIQRKAGGWTNRTVTQFKTDLSLSAADFGLGNVENTALSTWAGSANLTTLGTIGTGTWNGTTIAIAKGGTGATTAGGARTALGVAIGSDVQAWDADLDTWATKTAPAGAVVGTTDIQTLTNKSISGGQITSAVPTATALAANGTNCGVGLAAQGSDAQGNAEGCFAPSAGAPTDASYITQTADGTLSNEQALGALATGLLKNTTTTGVLSIATQGTDFYAPGGADIAIADGGTNASDAATARTNLGVAIGSNVQAWDADLDTWATKSSPAGTVADDSSVATFTNKSISGASNTFSNIPDAALSANVPLLNANNTRTGVDTYSSIEPRLKFSESDQTTDEKLVDFDCQTKVCAFRTRTDADAAGVNILAWTRGTGTAISNISLGNSTNNPSFTFLGTGAVTVNGNTTVPSIFASSTSPGQKYIETDQGTDLKRWIEEVNGAVWKFRTLTDADATGKDIVSVTRGTTTAITDISFGNASDNPTFNFLGTGNINFSGTPVSTNWFLSATAPTMRWIDTDQGTDLKRWSMSTDSGVLRLATITDANGAGKDAIAITRGATTAISNISMGNATDNPTYNFLGTGDSNFSGGVGALRFVVSGSTIPAAGIYRPGSNRLGFSATSALAAEVDANARFVTYFGRINKTRIVTAAGAITGATSDDFIGVNKTSGAATTVDLVACSAAQQGEVVTVKDVKGDAATNNITLDPNSTQLIDGASTYVISTNFGSVTAICDATSGWQITAVK